MKRLVALLVGLSVVCATISAGAIDQLLLFVLMGQIPFTNYSFGPITMLVFWVLFIPTGLLIRRFASHELWRIIELIGRIDQRKLNIRYRLQAHKDKLTSLVTITLIYTASQLPESTTNDPELYLRRRFVVLPA